MPDSSNAIWLLVLCLTAVVVATTCPISACAQVGGAAVKDARAVYVDTLLADPATHADAFYPIQGSPAVIGGKKYLHSVIMATASGRDEEKEATLTIRLNRGYDSFRAVVGRDDFQTSDGPAYAYFEVWGDRTLLYRSAPLCSSRYQVRVSGSAVPLLRHAPEIVDVSVRGLSLLRLVTRYAIDLNQQADHVEWARGCVWASPQLLPTLQNADANAIGRRLTTSVETLVRGAVRIGIVQLASQAAFAAANAAPTHALPLKIAVAPTTGMDMGASTHADTGVPWADSDVLSVIRDLLGAAGVGDGTQVFSVVTLAKRSGRARTLSEIEYRDSAQRAGAEWVLRRMAIAPDDTVQTWRLRLQITALSDGTALATVDVPVPGGLKN